jgi:hypothetical protein
MQTVSFIISGHQSQTPTDLSKKSEIISEIKGDLAHFEQRLVQLFSEGNDFNCMLLCLQYIQSKIYNSSNIATSILTRILEIIQANYLNLTPLEICNVKINQS